MDFQRLFPEDKLIKERYDVLVRTLNLSMSVSKKIHTEKCAFWQDCHDGFDHPRDCDCGADSINNEASDIYHILNSGLSPVQQLEAIDDALGITAGAEPKEAEDKTLRRGMGGHHSHLMGKDEWITPLDLISAIGPFDLDPCAPISGPWACADKCYTIEDDGLSKPWFGRVYCNPPYGKHTGRWLERCAEHGNAVALIFARTETRDWEKHVWGKAHSVMFLFGRLYFHHSSGERASANAGAPSALISYDEANTVVLEKSGLRGRVVRLRHSA